MALLRTIRITSIAGNPIAQVTDIDVCSTTGWEVVCQVAQALGFPSTSLSLVTQSAAVVDNNLPLQDSIAQDGCDDPIFLTCVLEPPRAVGVKGEKWRNHTRKPGMFLATKSLAGNKPCLRICREPDLAVRDPVEQLIMKSFAPRLKELIQVAVRAAYQPATAVALSTPAENCVFKDEALGACIDVSSCRLWTSMVVPTINTLAEGLASDRCYAGLDIPTHVVARAVLWRLLDGWLGAAHDAAGGAVAAGPVLEVLFAATAPDLVELGVSGQLVAELEQVATQIGCAAIAIAASPCQGKRFWSKQGYVVHVPLVEIAGQGDGVDPNDSSHAQTTLGEPQSALGEFLKAKMLLFTDKPLVAKVLRTS
eukprot:CAMPEP_0183437112 /NCGR_PEP_ID=MMETSP0370-20130417/71654_1 /TAXON_ID=268820 /ORGANISM="Peridinium aciculiferum, Strain PAER-2" /LENGTH=365 /DNA_ID=CAMNT_0025624791 /DNA_START=92 /DNA_END=1189 /DNA_ORIENTATION=+